MIGIIPTAGKGTRLDELGRNYPKCILPYKEKPIIVHNIKTMFESGCTEIRIGANYMIDQIEEVVDEYFQDDDRIIVIDVGETKSLPETVVSCFNEINVREELLIVLGDIIIDQKVPECDDSWIGVQTVKDFSRWCMVETDMDVETVIRFHDKPEKRPPTELAACGVYKFDDIGKLCTALNSIVRGQEQFDGEAQMSEVMDILMMDDEIYVEMVDVTDLGTIEDYRTHRDLKMSRSFNKVYVQENILVKESSDVEKIRSEFAWYKSLPHRLKQFIPDAFYVNINAGKARMHMEYLDSYKTLREIFLYGVRTENDWKNIFGNIFEIRELMSNHNSFEKPRFLKKMITKTINRFKSYECDAVEIDPEKVDFIIDLMDDNYAIEFFPDSLSHGDLCFSNIMYKYGSMKLIDPRGEYYGNELYDMAKLMHSVIYGYDFIDAELYTVSDDDPDDIVIYDDGKEMVKEIFMEYLERNYDEDSIRSIRIITASLFLSMIPLHYHNPTNQKLYYRKFEMICEELQEKTD